MSDPQLPYFVKWESPADVLPSALPGDIALASLEIAGSRQRIEDWMGEALPDVFDGVNIEFTSPNAHPASTPRSSPPPKGDSCVSDAPMNEPFPGSVSPLGMVPYPPHPGRCGRSVTGAV